MKKKIVPLVLVCAMLMSCFTFVAIAASEDDVLMPVSDGAAFEIIEGNQDPYTPITRDNYVAVDQSLTSSTGSQTVSFRTNSDYPYYRIFVSNTSTGAYDITLTNASGTNQLTTSPVVLNGGHSTTLTNANAASGMRYLTVTAKDGSSLSGSVRVRLASSADELATAVELQEFKTIDALTVGGVYVSEDDKAPMVETPAMASEVVRVHPVLKTADEGVSNVMVSISPTRLSSTASEASVTG